MKLNILICCVIALFLAGCSKDNVIRGKREDITLAEIDGDIINEQDIELTIVDEAEKNTAYAQSYVNASHCYAPLMFGENPVLIRDLAIDFKNSKSIKMASSPVFADGKLFFADAGGIIYAFDEKTGKRLWRISTTIVGKDGQIGCGIAYCSGKLIVTSSFAECFAINADDGSIIWRIKLPAASKGDGITIHNGKAFIVCSNSSLHAINIDNGKVVWSHSGMIADLTYLGCAGVAISADAAYVAYPSGEVFALMVETGIPLWDSVLSKFSLTNASHAISHPRACPVVYKDMLYVVGSNEQTVAFDVKTGQVIWRANYGGIQTPSVRGNSIFIANSNSEIVCLNRMNGKKRWETTMKLGEYDLPSGWIGQLLIKDYLLMISPDGHMFYISIYDGKVKKNIEIDDADEGITVNPIIANEALFILMNCGRVVTYK